MQDLIITGIPRSGTSLAGAIIDQLPNAVCLSEPEHQVDLMEAADTAEKFVTHLGADFDAIRQTLLVGGTVLDRRGDGGRPVTNYFGRRTPEGQRGVAYAVMPISRKGISPDFLLAIKHNALYAGVLPEITRNTRFRVVAIVRDPVSVLLSLRSLELPMSRGRLPAAERFWPEMAKLTRTEMDLTDKQICICDLLCRRFAEPARGVTVVRYESFVADPAVLMAACDVKTRAARAVIEHQDSAGEQSDAAAITKRIQHMAANGDLPGICHFYPSYLNGGADHRFYEADG
jgi:hypothetical protein